MLVHYLHDGLRLYAGRRRRGRVAHHDGGVLPAAAELDHHPLAHGHKRRFLRPHGVGETAPYRSGNYDFCVLHDLLHGVLGKAMRPPPECKFTYISRPAPASGRFPRACDYGKSISAPSIISFYRYPFLLALPPRTALKARVRTVRRGAGSVCKDGNAMCGTVFMMCVEGLTRKSENAHSPRWDFYAKAGEPDKDRNFRTAVEPELRLNRCPGSCHHDAGMIMPETNHKFADTNYFSYIRT